MQSAFAKKHLKTLGQSIRALRHAQSLSQEDLAARAQIHVTYLSSLECGKRNPSMAIFFSLAHALKVTPSELLFCPSQAETLTGADRRRVNKRN